MTDPRFFTLHHAPQSRSTGVLGLLHELGLVEGRDYRIRLLDLKSGQNREPGFLSINPMGKVPTIVHAGAVVTEQPAIYQYLAELFPEAGLAPAIGDPLRGPFLRWLAFYGSCFEPALVDRAQQRTPAPPGMCPYSDFDTMYDSFVRQLARGPWMLGGRFSALDILWGSALAWTLRFGLLPSLPVLTDYVARVAARPAVLAAQEQDARLLAEVEAWRAGRAAKG
ncbi:MULTISPECIES: glutathione S-transferase family protein [Derxia]|uniref:Glutathione S-transferase family protein n=1 Tax=Derxia gummosa DSM 723 TaxID=1121388 RepID=A0A8B6X215_9BURK|nr:MULTISPECIES: glutathione S-transferase family protein [Derxia]